MATYQILNTAMMAKYSPNQYQRLPSGAVILNPGVTPIAGTVKETTATAPTTQTAGTQYQILDLAAMSKYRADQYQRLPDGRVVLNPGVTPIAGTVKQVASTPAGSTSANIPATTADQGTLDSINKLLDEQYPTLTPTIRQFLMDNFGKSDTFIGKTAPTDSEIAQQISDATTSAETDMNKRYTRVSSEELADFKKQMSDIRAKSETFKANEENTYQKTLANTKQTLRAKGLTFSGTSLKNIGSESALRNSTGMEGSVQTARRLDYEGALQGFQQQASGLATEAERRLGTAPVAGALGEVGSLAAPTDLSRLATPVATTAGGYGGTGSMASTIDQERAAAIESSAQQRLAQYRLTI